MKNHQNDHVELEDSNTLYCIQLYASDSPVSFVFAMYRSWFHVGCLIEKNIWYDICSCWVQEWCCQHCQTCFEYSRLYHLLVVFVASQTNILSFDVSWHFVLFCLFVFLLPSQYYFAAKGWKHPLWHGFFIRIFWPHQWRYWLYRSACSLQSLTNKGEDCKKSTSCTLYSRHVMLLTKLRKPVIVLLKNNQKNQNTCIFLRVSSLFPESEKHLKPQLFFSVSLVWAKISRWRMNTLSASNHHISNSLLKFMLYFTSSL